MGIPFLKKGKKEGGTGGKETSPRKGKMRAKFFLVESWRASLALVNPALPDPICFEQTGAICLDGAARAVRLDLYLAPYFSPEQRQPEGGPRQTRRAGCAVQLGTRLNQEARQLGQGPCTSQVPKFKSQLVYCTGGLSTSLDIPMLEINPAGKH